MKKIDSMEFFEKLAQEGKLIEEIEKFINDESIPDFPSNKFFTPKQWDALTGEIPMTQEIFDRCLYVCDSIDDGVNFQRIIGQFPEFEVKYTPEVCAKHKAAYEEFKEEYINKFGSDDNFFF